MHSATEDAPRQLTDDRQRAFVKTVQRAWIVSAMAELVCEHGQDAVSVRQVTARAGVSRRRFYDLFDNCEDCFRATFDEAITRASERACVGYCSSEVWTDRLRAGLSQLLAFFDSEPELARLSILYATPASPAKALRSEVLAQLAGLIDMGGRAALGGANPPALVAETVVNGAVGVIQARLLEPSPGPLTALVNPLMSVIVVPYLGREAASHELNRPTTDSSGDGGSNAREPHPLAGLRMRLTYRTMRVLAEIVAAPGISNRAIADAAGARDAGQISKLLSRLQSHGLVLNTGAGQAKGAANAWIVTARGAEIARTMAPRLVGRAQMS